MVNGVKEIVAKCDKEMQKMDEAFIPERAVYLSKEERKASKAYEAKIKEDPKKIGEEAISRLIERVQPIMGYPSLMDCLKIVEGLIKDYPHSAAWDMAAMVLRRELVSIAMKFQDFETAKIREKQKKYDEEVKVLAEDWMEKAKALSSFIGSDECRIEYLENRLRDI